VKKSNGFIASPILFILLIAALGTAILPVISVKVPPLGARSWSVMDLAAPILERVVPKEKKKSWIKVDVDKDFFEVLGKILPRDAKSGESQKVSLTFILGALVPVALILCYLFLALSLLCVLILRGLLKTTTVVALLTSIYGLVGTFYLGQAAQQAFANSVDRGPGGLLGAITRSFVPEITIVPDSGLYALVLLSALVFAANAIFGKQ